VTVSIVEFEVTFVSVQDWNGTETITFTVNDARGRDIASDSIDIIVTPVNDAPEITGQDQLFTPEETPLTITLGDLSVEDIDNTYPDDFTLTVLEGEWDEVMEVVKRCYEIMRSDCKRITCSVKIDYREGKKGRLKSKMASVEEKLGKKLKT